MRIFWVLFRMLLGHSSSRFSLSWFVRFLSRFWLHRQSFSQESLRTIWWQLRTFWWRRQACLSFNRWQLGCSSSLRLWGLWDRRLGRSRRWLCCTFFVPCSRCRWESSSWRLREIQVRKRTRCVPNTSCRILRVRDLKNSKCLPLRLSTRVSCAGIISTVEWLVLFFVAVWSLRGIRSSLWVVIVVVWGWGVRFILWRLRTCRRLACLRENVFFLLGILRFRFGLSSSFPKLLVFDIRDRQWFRIKISFRWI